MPFNDLREFVGFLESKGELIRTQKPVDVKYEISAYIRKTSDRARSGAALRQRQEFRHAGGGRHICDAQESFSRLGNFATRITFNKFQNALDHLVAPKWVSNAPCKDVSHPGPRRRPDATSHPDFFRKRSRRRSSP